jgi:hypothetical protein
LPCCMFWEPGKATTGKLPTLEPGPIDTCAFEPRLRRPTPTGRTVRAGCYMIARLQKLHGHARARAHTQTNMRARKPAHARMHIRLIAAEIMAACVELPIKRWRATVRMADEGRSTALARTTQPAVCGVHVHDAVDLMNAHERVHHVHQLRQSEPMPNLPGASPLCQTEQAARKTVTQTLCFAERTVWWKSICRSWCFVFGGAYVGLVEHPQVGTTGASSQARVARRA